MKTKKEFDKLAIALIILSIMFFGIFCWWGTTSYEPKFAIGIFLVSIGTFLTGIILLTQKDN